MFASLLCRRKLDALYRMVSHFQLLADEDSEAEEFLISLRKEIEDSIMKTGGHITHKEQMEGFNKQ